MRGLVSPAQTPREPIVLHRPPRLDRSPYPLDWNGPGTRAYAPFAEADLARPVFELFVAAAQRHGERIALDDGTTRLTYAETLAAARTLARRLALQTQAADLVGILLPSCCDFAVAMLACLAAARLFVPLDSHYPRAWLEGVIGDCGLAAVIGRFGGEDGLVPVHVHRIDLAQDEACPATPLDPAGPDAPAFVLFTSGSTGKPKGIVNSQRALLRRLTQYTHAAHVDATDSFLPLSSECTIAGLRERFTALLTGATLHLIDVQRSGARQILDRLDGVTMVYGVPALLRSLMQLGAGKAPASLRVLRVGGDAVLWSDIDALRDWLPADCRIELGYSSTEAPIMQWFVPADFPRDGDRVPLGYPLAGNTLAIVDDAGDAAKPGESGELVLRSPYVALGRWQDGAVDAKDFPADPDDPICRVHRTGDLVRLRADGLIDLVGRKDRQIKIRGVRVEPGELEAAIRRRPGVRDVAVFPRRVGPHWWLIAYVCGETAELKSFLRAALPAALQPHRIHEVDAIPRLASAKLDMAALAALDEIWQRREVESTPFVSAPPVGKTEETIAAIWARVLDCDCVGRDDDFFDWGGDSLSTLNLMFALEEAFGTQLPVTAIYAVPTVATLAAVIDGQRATEFSPLVCIRQGSGTPLLIVHGVGGNVMELVACGRRIAGDGPVYAIQARGLDGKEAPSTSIAAMAHDYIAQIRKTFGDGACHLAGYSSGGLIAFEMACRLGASGTASLTLIDSQTNARQWPLTVWGGLLARRAAHHARTLSSLSLREKLSYMRGVAASFGHRVLWRLGAERAAVQMPSSLAVPPALQAVADATLEAAAQYVPGRYDGALLLIVPERGDAMRPDPAKLWRGRCAAMTVRFVPGDHRSMVQGENAVHLAAVLSDVVAL